MEKNDERGTGLSRRRLPTAGGAAGAGLIASAAVIPGFTGIASAATGVPANTGYYGRIFPQLEPFASVNSTVIDALMEVGQRGGIMDALDNLAAGPKALITDPAVNGNPTSTNPSRHQPRQPDDDRGVDVRRPIHRPRHHLRPDITARCHPKP